MNTKLHIQPPTLVASTMFVGALLVTAAMAAGVAALAAAPPLRDAGVLVVTATRLTPNATAEAQKPSAGSVTGCRTLAC